MTKQLFPLSTILYCDCKCHANSDVGVFKSYTETEMQSNTDTGGSAIL